MGKITTWSVVGLILGGMANFIIGIVAFLYLFPPSANEVVQHGESNNQIAPAKFIQINLSDPGAH